MTDPARIRVRCCWPPGTPSLTTASPTRRLRQLATPFPAPAAFVRDDAAGPVGPTAPITTAPQDSLVVIVPPPGLVGSWAPGPTNSSRQIGAEFLGHVERSRVPAHRSWPAATNTHPDHDDGDHA